MTPEQRIHEFYPDMVKIRRKLHSIPELGTQELKTAKTICTYLDSYGISYEYPVADTGIVATIRGCASHSSGNISHNNTVALRADMDALPLSESKDRTYCSLHDGRMHACGHDAHTTIALSTAKILKDIEDSWSGCVKIFFQPAEETVGGADRMIQAGCMENPHVDYVTGLHVMPYYDSGEIEVRYGKLNASSDEVHINVEGVSCHGAAPNQGIDAIVIAATLITSLQSLVSRNISPFNHVVLTLGKIEGGSAGNIVASQVTITGTLRTTDPVTRKMAADTIIRQTESICLAFGGKGTAVITPGYSALINHDDMVDLLIQTAEPIIGKDHIHQKEFPSLGVEDFSFFLEKAPGVFYHLGCGNSEKGITAPLHSNHFDIDESCLEIGVRLQTALTLELLKK